MFTKADMHNRQTVKCFSVIHKSINYQNLAVRGSVIFFFVLFFFYSHLIFSTFSIKYNTFSIFSLCINGTLVCLLTHINEFKLKYEKNLAISFKKAQIRIPENL